MKISGKMSRSIFINVEGLKKDGDFSILENRHNVNLIKNHIENNDIHIERGDIINLIEECKRYRNSGKLIWNGNNPMWLSNYQNYDDISEYYENTLDEYGYVPSCFIVSDDEFSPDYWIKNVKHNGIYWPCEDYRIQVIENLEFSKRLTKNEIWNSFFTCNGRIFNFAINEETFSNLTSGEFNYEDSDECENEIISIIEDMKKPFEYFGSDQFDICDEENCQISTVF